MTDEPQYRSSANLKNRIALHEKYGAQGGLATFHRVLPIKAGSRVLEVGCGTGRFWEQGADVLPDDLRIMLTDSSPAMVEEARRRVAGLERWTQVEALVADVCALPFENGSFDAVIAMHMLYHASDKDRAVSEIARILGPDGLLVLTTNGRDNLRNLFELGSRAYGGPACDLGALAFGLEDVPAALSSRFHQVAVTKFEDRLAISDPADVIAYLASSPAGKRAGEQEMQTLRSLVESAFDAQGGVIEAKRVTGFALARRTGAPAP